MPRLGLSLAPSNQFSIEEFLRLIVLAEDVGYESVWIPETWAFDAVSFLATLAAATSRIKLASGVFNVFSRSAALLAQTAATLQLLSGGRFLLGLGVSGPRVVEKWHGVPYASPLVRTREYVDVIRIALSGQRVDYHGEQLHLQGFRLDLEFPQPVPIYIAALGPRNVRLAGAIADGWLPIFAARGYMGPLFEELIAGALAAGRDPEAIDVAAYLPALVGPRAERLLRQQLAYYIGAMGTYYFELMTRMGFGEEAARIRNRWSSGDRIGAVESVDQRLLDRCTLGTDPSAARNRLDEYRKLGIGLPIVTLPNGCSADAAANTIRALAG